MQLGMASLKCQTVNGRWQQRWRRRGVECLSETFWDAIDDISDWVRCCPRFTFGRWVVFLLFGTRPFSSTPPISSLGPSGRLPLRVWKAIDPFSNQSSHPVFYPAFSFVSFSSLKARERTTCFSFPRRALRMLNAFFPILKVHFHIWFLINACRPVEHQCRGSIESKKKRKQT